jgi:segregation and condensation protein B
MKKRKKIEDAAPEQSPPGSEGDAEGDGNEEREVSEGNEGIQATTEGDGAPGTGTPHEGERTTNPYMEVPSFDEKEEDTKVGDAPVDEAAVAENGEMRAAHEADEWEGPTQEGSQEELAALAAESTTIVDEPVLPDEASEGEAAAAPADGDVTPPELGVAGAGRLEAVIESLLFASDHPLTVNELKKLVGERDGAKITAAVTALQTARQETGINVISVAGGWHLRTNPTNVAWVSRLIAGKPQRLSRAMLETLAIVAYRQPITRPEVDDIRGVDCGPVLKTLLDRGLIRMIGKKEDVGRPILYGTTPEFLRTFSLRDLTELPTLREFHELGADEQAEVDAKAPRAEGEGAEAAAPGAQEPLRPAPPPRRELDPEEDDELLSELERAAAAAAAASAASAPPPEAEQPPAAPTDAPTGDAAAAPPPRSDG